jgi:hypothetical protein
MLKLFYVVVTINVHIGVVAVIIDNDDVADVAAASDVALVVYAVIDDVDVVAIVLDDVASGVITIVAKPTITIDKGLE